MAEGLPYYERALRISRDLSKAHPESRFHAVELVKRLVALGNIRRHQGVPVDVRSLFTEAKSIVDRLLGSSPGDVTLKTWLALVLLNQADTVMDEDRPHEARPLLERAAAIFRQAPNRPTSTSELSLGREA